MTTATIKEESEVMVIRIQIDEGVRGVNSLSFTTLRSLPLRSVFLDFCDRLEFVYSTVRFISSEGTRINETDSAEKHGISDGDVIDAFYEQIGAGGGGGGGGGGGSSPTCLIPNIN